MIYNLPRKKRKRITNCLTFSSPDPFSISVATPGWDGKLYCSTDAATWSEWTGSKANAAKIGGIYALYFRGVGNTKITGDLSNKGGWTLNGGSISCTGNIESLLDYETVAAGQHPTMAGSCYSYMFNGCTSLTAAPSLPATKLALSCYAYMFNNCTNLTTAPSLPATTLMSSCYVNMFGGCTSLTAVPSLPATKLALSCYAGMFASCTSIKLAISQSSEYDKEYRIPKSGDGVKSFNALNGMFRGTGGTFTGTPSINTTYYTSNNIV